jgi:bifunctional pyridoxal-dependent enzyme with beta-cystathionase and maltose regulon repressor activities
MTKFVRESNSIKYTGHNQDDLVLTIADMDLPLYPPIKKAIISKLQITNNFTYKLPSKQYY